MSDGSSILAKDGKWYTEDQRPGLFRDFEATKKRLLAIRNEPDEQVQEQHSNARVLQQHNMLQQPELQDPYKYQEHEDIHQLLVPEEVQGAFELEG